MSPPLRDVLSVRPWTSLGEQLSKCYQVPDPAAGPTNAHANLRLFEAGGVPEVTLFRDNHGWCPYCQKVWLFLEEKKVNYDVRKVTMFCYGKKEAWYKKIVPSGMLPALQVKQTGEVVTESDAILARLEQLFGPLGPVPLSHAEVELNRRLERKLFSAWCSWLCRPSWTAEEEAGAKEDFCSVCREVERRIGESLGPFLLSEFGVSDTILCPYIERMQSSLFYYKGFNMRETFPVISAWFSAMEQRSTYQGTKSDHHTHVHDLPPQMGGCYHDANCLKASPSLVEVVKGAMDSVDAPSLNSDSSSLEVDASAFPEPATSRLEAAYRVMRHRQVLAQISPVHSSSPDAFDVGVRAVLTRLLADCSYRHFPDVASVERTGTMDQLPPGGALALLYMRDRLSIPRDMGFWAGRRLRQTLSDVASDYGSAQDWEIYRGDPRWRIPREHRRDADPTPFRAAVKA
ncbi:unnamed protein product [Prorocentrum cordatum]|nr:unnamed protein product [Polarella glacialis]